MTQKISKDDPYLADLIKKLCKEWSQIVEWEDFYMNSVLSEIKDNQVMLLDFLCKHFQSFVFLFAINCAPSGVDVKTRIAAGHMDFATNQWSVTMAFLESISKNIVTLPQLNVFGLLFLMHNNQCFGPFATPELKNAVQNQWNIINPKGSVAHCVDELNALQVFSPIVLKGATNVDLTAIEIDKIFDSIPLSVQVMVGHNAFLKAHMTATIEPSPSGEHWFQGIIHRLFYVDERLPVLQIIQKNALLTNYDSVCSVGKLPKFSAKRSRAKPVDEPEEDDEPEEEDEDEEEDNPPRRETRAQSKKRLEKKKHKSS
jgi:hypothetical protein